MTTDLSKAAVGAAAVSASSASERPVRPVRSYEPPRLVRVAVRTTRDNLNWQYAGQSVCTNHNHSDPGGGTNGCSFPL